MSENLREARIKAGLTQSQAAGLVHVTTRAWQNWESGDRVPHPAFVELFDIKLRFLLVGEKK